MLPGARNVRDRPSNDIEKQVIAREHFHDSLFYSFGGENGSPLLDKKLRDYGCSA